MDTIQSKLGFSIPQKDSAVKTSVDLNTKSMNEWVDHLPISDTGACTKIIFNFLKELNACDADFKTKFNAIESIRTAINTCGLSLKKHYYTHHAGLTSKQISIARLSCALFNETCLLYKDIIDGASGKISANSSILATSIFRYLHFSRLILQTSYLLYEAAPKSLWQETYSIYKFAKSNNLAETEILNKTASDKLPNIEKSFLKTIILASANPFQLRQIEQESIGKASFDWVNHLSIKPFAENHIKEPGNYVFNLDSDIPPTPAGLGKFTTGKELFVINASAVSNILGKVLNDLQSGELRARNKNSLDLNYSLPISTIQKLCHNWSTVLSRVNSRFALGGKMTIAIGTPAAHYYISGKKDFTSSGSTNGSSLPSDGDGLSFDTSELPTFDIDDGSDTLDVDDNEQKAIDDFANFQCETINVSPTGSCLKWLADSHPAVEPGEVVCMRNTDMEDDQWSIGVIRWLKHDSENNLKIGIQLLGPYAKPAGIQLIKDDSPVSCFLRSLILPEVESLGMKRTIITPVLPFKVGSIINIKMDDSDEPIRSELLTQADQTSYYKQFEYKSDKSQELIDKALEKQSVAKGANIKDNEAKMNKKEDSTNSNDEFGNIWDDL